MASAQPNPDNLIPYSAGASSPAPSQGVTAQPFPATSAETGARAGSTGISSLPFENTDAAAYSFDNTQQTPITAQGSQPNPDNLVPYVSSSTQARHEAENISTATEGFLEDPTQAASVFLEGLTYGWSEEIGAGIAASAAWLTQDGNESFGSIYDDMMGHLELDREAYASQHPGAAFALEMAGGILSPLNKVIFAATGAAGGFAATKADDLLNLGNKVFPKSNLSDATRVQRSLRKLDARTGSPTVLDKATAPVESMLQRGVRVTKEAVPSAVVGGALYGAGKSENTGTDDIMERLGGIAQDAKEGAAWGAALSPLVGLIRAGADRFTRRRIAQELQQGDNFVPINVAVGPGDSKVAQGLQWLYRNVIGKAWLGGSIIQNQQSRWRTATMSPSQLAKKELQKLRSRLATLTKQIEKDQKLRTAELADEIKDNATRAKSAMGDAASVSSRATEAARQAREAKVKELTAMIQIVQNRFRNEVIRESIPTGATQKEIKDIMDTMESGDFLELNRKMRQLWQERGFSMLHDRSFPFGAQTRADLIADINAAIDGDETIRGLKLDGAVDNAAEIISDFFDTNVINGRMSGASVVALRNRISDLTKGAPSNSSETIQLHVLKKVREILDDYTLSQLKPAAQSLFRRHQEQWRVRLGMDKSIANTAGLNGKPNQRGTFEVKDWVNTTRQIWAQEAKDGRAPFQRIAMGYDDDITKANQGIENAFDAQLSDIATTQLRESGTRIAALQNEIREAEKALEMNSRGERTRVSTEQARSTIIAGEPNASEIAALEKRLELLVEQRETVKNAFAKSNASVVEKGLMAYFLSGGTNLMGGILIAGGAASRPGQNFLAGQTGWQKWTQQQLRAGELGREAQQALDARNRVTLGTKSSLAGDVGGSPINESTMNAILKASLPVKRQYYARLKARGQLERVRAFYPEQLKSLEEAINTTQ